MLQEDKLEPSEQLGDLLKQAGDADAALKCYRSSGATTKVIEGELSQQTTVLSYIHCCLILYSPLTVMHVWSLCVGCTCPVITYMLLCNTIIN